jgi:hypothetical protein
MICRPSLALSLLLSAALTASAQQAALFDELVPLFPDSDPTSGAEVFTTATPRGVPAAVHALIGGLPEGAEVRWSCDGARAFRLIDVPVEQNTGLDSRTEVWKGVKNPHVIRRAPFRVFEVLEPIGGVTRAAALRFELEIEADAEPGERELTITLESGEWKQELSWRLIVLPAVVPETSAESPGYTNWFSPSIIAERHGLTIWSEPFWEMLARYAELMERGRQNTFWIRWGDFARLNQEGELEVDRVRLERYVRLFLEHGFTRVEGGHVARRHQGDWGSPRLDLVITGSDVNSEKGRAELATLLGCVKLELPEGITYLQHLTDEPSDSNAESYIELAGEVRRLLPGVRIFEATMSLKLVGAVDCWCPQVQEYQKHRDFFVERQRSGDEVWVYTCLAPGGVWLNRLLDQEHLRQVYLGWSLVRYDLDGFLHWGLNHYRSGVDPFEQSVVPHGEGAPNFLPAGDSHVVYPGVDGPLSGLRFEAHRIGMEDAELLRILKAKDPERAAGIVNRVLRAYDDYETDVGAYRAARLELLGAL